MPSPSTTARADAPSTRRRGWGVIAFVSAWFVLTSLLGAWTVAQHLVPLPGAAPADQASGPLPAAWYVLGEDCGCSASVAEDLVARGPQAGWREQVWLVGEVPELGERLRQRGFAVESIAAEELARRHRIHGAPWLALFAQDGRLAYSGGFARTRPGLPGAFNLSGDIMHAVAAGRPVEPLPAYGCATSEALRDRLDPLRLRYTSRQP